MIYAGTKQVLIGITVLPYLYLCVQNTPYWQEALLFKLGHDFISIDEIDLRHLKV